MFLNIHLSFMFILYLNIFVCKGLLPRRSMRYEYSQSRNLTEVDYYATLLHSEAANISHSYAIIASLPLKSFEFKYDTIAGRRQIGCLGNDILNQYSQHDIEVHIIPQSIRMDQITKEKVSLKNFHVVDKDSLFMHNVGAMQVVIATQTQHDEILIEHKHLLANIHEEMQILQKYLEQEALATVVEQRKLQELQLLEIEKNIEYITLKEREERDTLTLKQTMDVQMEELKALKAAQQLKEKDLLTRDQNKELVEMQEASHIRLEMTRRETATVLKEKELENERERMHLERNTTLEKAVIDVDGRIKQQRMNADIESQLLQQTLSADKDKLLAAIQATFDRVGQGLHILFTDKQKAIQFVSSFIALAAGVYISRETVRILGKLIEQQLGKPSLVRETSRQTGVYGVLHGLLFTDRIAEFILRVWNWLIGHDPNLVIAQRQKQQLADVVLREDLETRVLEIARSTRNAKKHGAPYRHLLLYGPPGTGKTMVAKRLAKCSGMDYAILSGGDVGPLGSDAVTELHALFKWAKSPTQRKGVLIFIDEAEAFLGCRATRKTHMSEAMRNALNALLFHTGSQSRSYMLVIATNRPEDLDTAMTDRIDDTLYFNLPSIEEREKLIYMYFQEYCSTSIEMEPDLKENQSQIQELKQYGACTEGMSGREIAKMMLYLQSIAYAQEEVIVTKKLISRVVQEKVAEHARKKELRQYKEE